MSPFLMSIWWPISIGLLLNLAAALWAYRRGSVTRSGGIAGVLVGAGIFAGAGAFGWGLLMLFFLGSTALGKMKEARGLDLERMHEKGDRRDAEQVLANAGIGLITSLLFGLTLWPGFLLAASVSFASANADTWASEIGVLSDRPPVSIRTGRAVPHGASGGVSLLGFAGSAVGAAVIGIYFVIAAPIRDILPFGTFVSFLIILVGGLLGSVIDSLLGATLQAQYRDAETGGYTERASTGPGEGTAPGDSRPEGARANTLIRGFTRITNDTVNFLSCAGATAASLVTAVSVM